MNIKNILVPVDFSPPSASAVNYGVTLARKFRARLTLLHVLEYAAEIEHIKKERREEVERMLWALLAPEDQDDLDLRVVLKSGAVEAGIAAAIVEQEADMVVLGTHSKGFLDRLLIGSTTQSLLRKVTIPIVTVRQANRSVKLNRILFATDLSETARYGFESALELARTTNSDLLVLHVVERIPLTYGGDEMLAYFDEHKLDDARARLAELSIENRTGTVRIETLLMEGEAAEGILKAADDNEVDLVLLSIEKKTLLERALLGSTAERVIRESRLPVLSIPTTAVNINKQEHQVCSK